MVCRLATDQRRQPVQRHSVEARQDLAELACDLYSRAVVGRIAEQLAGDGDAADPAHDEGLAQSVFGREFEQHFRGADAGPESGMQDTKLGGAVDRD